MTAFTILLGGDLIVTPRLRRQIAGSRVIAADSGMMHAAALRILPERWVGDFDSAGSELMIQYRDVPRRNFPGEKDATDGEIAIDDALAEGATMIILAGGLGGQADHATGLMGQALGLARRGIATLLTSGIEEAFPVLPGRRALDVPPGTRLSIVPFTDLEGLDLAGVKWPLTQRNVPLGSSLTLSNVTQDGAVMTLRAGYGMGFVYPDAGVDV